VLPGDLNKKRRFVHVTMVERTKELLDPVSRSVAPRKIVQHNDPFSPRAQVVCRVTLPMDPSPRDTSLSLRISAWELRGSHIQSGLAGPGVV
jgi:hypothetical protein